MPVSLSLTTVIAVAGFLSPIYFLLFRIHRDIGGMETAVESNSDDVANLDDRVDVVENEVDEHDDRIDDVEEVLLP